MSQNYLLIGLLAIFTISCANQKPQRLLVPDSDSSIVSHAPYSTISPRSNHIDSNDTDAVPISINRKLGFDADIFHYSHQGSGFFPWIVVRALIDSETKEPYLNNLERFGLVPGEKSKQWNPDGLPVGIVINTLKVQNKDLKMFGFTCAACHTSDIRYQDKIVRIEGGSGLFYVDALGDAIAASLERTLSDKRELFAFLKRLTGEMDEQERSLFGGLETIIKQTEDDGQFAEQLREHVHKRMLAIRKGGGEAKQLAHAEIEKIAHRLRASVKPQSLGKNISEKKELADITHSLSSLEQSLAHLKYRLRFLKVRAWLAKPGNRLPGGYGRADDFGTARVELFGDLDESHGTSQQRNMEPVNAPVSSPPLWNIDQYAWLHWNGNTNSIVQRSLGQSIGVGATYDTDGPTKYQTSVNVVNQMKGEQQIARIASPEWPEEMLGKIDRTKRDRGAKIYLEKCAGCHNPSTRNAEGLLEFHMFTLEKTGTDPAYAVNFSRPVILPDGTKIGFAKAMAELLRELQAKAKFNMSKEYQLMMEELEQRRTPIWRDPMTQNNSKVYPARPLDGIWATAPYLHNGSVPTLYHLLLAAKDRPTKFVTGPQDFLPKQVGFEWDPNDFPSMRDKHNQHRKLFLIDTSLAGNRNTGHEYGADLTEDERWALVEYLKVHKTPALSQLWEGVQAGIEKRHQDYLRQNAQGYDWFANAANGYSGVPFILLRSLPDLAPNIWGPPEERFSRFGFISSPAEPNRPLPIGLSWDSMDAGRNNPLINGVTLTCGACHIGRIRVTDEPMSTYKILVGAPNTQFDVRLWRNAFEQTVKNYLNSPEDIVKMAQRLREVIGSKPENYYYGKYRGMSEEVEKREREVFLSKQGKDVAAEILSNFAQSILRGKAAVDKQKATSYSKKNAPPLDGGSPGQSDGSGDLIPRLLLLDTIREKGAQSALQDFPSMTFHALPNKKATVTDIVSTFNQGSRNIAQIDGSVKSPFFRNIAASLAVAGNPDQVNVRNADITATFIRSLSAPAYPFIVDMDRANRGRKLFQENCIHCHRSGNENLYKAANDITPEQIGTDANRSQVLNKDALKLFLKHFIDSVPKDYETTDMAGNNYRPRDLPVSEIVIDRTDFKNQGYVTNALEGIWSRAPYLHNGSVPTLYHLLVPSERPAKFVRGVISYDQQKVGWVWGLDALDQYQKIDPTAAVFDTRWDGASSQGHNKNLTVDVNGRIIRMGWSEVSEPGSYKVRMDWGGIENSRELGDLLEYLKTL